MSRAISFIEKQKKISFHQCICPFMHWRNKNQLIKPEFADRKLYTM